MNKPPQFFNPQIETDHRQWSYLNGPSFVIDYGRGNSAKEKTIAG
jgi:hypothetical protein